MNTYLIRWRPRVIGAQWLPEHQGADTPTTLEQAAALYVSVEEHCPNDAVQVLRVDEAAGRFTDVTNEVVEYIFNQQQQRAVWASEDAAHERQESMRGVFV